ncbi:hypothetical protein TVAG_020660 [Trichomonas vaginalis G3]|uniref:Ubiquitin-like domain-containing protein n=1 Tax=Trichomonas vaginalis (strain ATCC PRA-98 / G3) TaxID=412133 RepID=A2EXY0_TRIV3|nr:hypothetical protein TVAGG3_0318130 [Trichomonas vaginalis G3]EAY02513.1 hypothetical protein TVAG_020660 [Trichomonas vaginalis G3]KAI5529089.1 hypothetical protein TVAGG3_0318130 [Trichomonas vaginalis G3]|eukprot:XP_001314752.1 hypothetical protein [Trichomonas vaginalis G3]
MFVQSPLITIYLHDANAEVREVTVNKTDCLQVLEDEIKGDDKRFIMYKNALLMMSFSFQFFGIKDGDHLYVLRAKYNNKKRESVDTSKILAQKQLNNRGRVVLANGSVEIIDKSALLECTRLLDLMYLRDDYMSPASRRGLELPTTDAPQSDNGVKSTIPAVRLTEPSTDVLPIFWTPRHKRLLS